MALSLEGIQNMLRQQGLQSPEPEPSFYTYGAIPSSEVPDLPVATPLQGFAKGGKVSSASGRVVPPEGYPPGTLGSAYEPGSTLPPGVDPMAPIPDITDPQQAAKMMALFSLLPSDAFGNMGSVSDPNIAASARTIADTRPAGGLQGQQFEEGYLEAQKAGPLLGIWQSGLEDLLAEDPGVQARVSEMETERAERIAGLEESIPKLKPLSDLLKSGQFEEAFEYAKANNLTDQLMKTENLKNLRGPFSREEMAKFFNAIPADVAQQFSGEGWIFDPSRGASESLDPLNTGGKGAMNEGFPDPSRAFTRKDSGIIKQVVDIGMQLALASAGLPPLTAMAAAGVAKAATTGGDIEAALKAAAMAGVGSYVGGKVGEALEAAKGGTEAAASQAVANAAKAAGSIDDLVEVVVTGTRSSLPGGLAAAGTSLAGQQALRETATPKDLEEVVVRSPPELEEVVVQALRKAPPRDLQNLFASLGTAGTQDILSERDIAELQEAEQRMVEEQAATEQQTPPEEPIETFRIPGTLPRLDIAEVIPGLATQLALAGYRAPLIEGQAPPTEEALDAMEEVVVRGQPPVNKIDLTDVALGGLTAAQIAQGFTQPNVDPTTGELREPLESQQELDKIQEALASGTTIPGPKSMLDKISSVADKLSKAEKLLALLGGLGGALGGRESAGTGGGGLPVARDDGALPVYEFGRVQTRPNIDYFTYGTRPEELFFQDTMTRVEPQPQPQPEPEPELDTGIAPPNEGGPFAQGGLASGGRYYEGEGSGRDDKIPALLSDGEYVIDAETLALLGDGSTKEGARRMDQFRAKIRKHKGSALSRGRISPNAKSPDKYMGGGLRR